MYELRLGCSKVVRNTHCKRVETDRFSVYLVKFHLNQDVFDVLNMNVQTYHTECSKFRPTIQNRQAVEELVEACENDEINLLINQC